MEDFREKLKEKCKKCEFYGTKLDKEPFWVPCKIMIEKVENCIFHYSDKKEYEFYQDVKKKENE